MEKKLDISWKDFLALLVGYFVSAFCIGAVFFGLGYLRAQGLVGEEVFAKYEFPIALATFAACALGGAAIGAIRPTVATRNASVLLVGMIVYGLWRSVEVDLRFLDIVWSSLQIGGGMFFGAWAFRKIYVRYLIKKYYPEYAE